MGRGEIPRKAQSSRGKGLAILKTIQPSLFNKEVKGERFMGLACGLRLECSG